MKKSILALLCGALLAGSAMAAGQAPANLADYAGQYVLADGRILTVREADGHLAATIAARRATHAATRIDTAREVALKPDGLGGFVATASPLRIRFAQDARGEYAQVRLDEAAAPMMAQR